MEKALIDSTMIFALEVAVRTAHLNDGMAISFCLIVVTVYSAYTSRKAKK